MANQANFPPFKSDNRFRIVKVHRHAPLGHEEGKTGSSHDGLMGRKTVSPPPRNCQESHKSTLPWRVFSHCCSALETATCFWTLEPSRGFRGIWIHKDERLCTYIQNLLFREFPDRVPSVLHEPSVAGASNPDLPLSPLRLNSQLLVQAWDMSRRVQLSWPKWIAESELKKERFATRDENDHRQAKPSFPGFLAQLSGRVIRF